MNRASLSLTLASCALLSSAAAHAQSPPSPPRACSDDGLGRRSRFVGRIDYGPRWYVRPTGAPFAFDFSFGAGYWIAATSGCEPWLLRVQPEASLDFSVFDRAPVEARGRGGVSIGAASLLVQLSYFVGGGYGSALRSDGAVLVHGPRLEAFFGAAGVELQHGYFPRAAGDLHSIALHGMIDVYATVALFTGLARWAR